MLTECSSHPDARQVWGVCNRLKEAPRAWERCPAARAGARLFSAAMPGAARPPPCRLLFTEESSAAPTRPFADAHARLA